MSPTFRECKLENVMIKLLQRNEHIQLLKQVGIGLIMKMS